MAATAYRGYWPGCYSPQYSLGVLVWLLQAPGWPRVLAWQLQAPGCSGVLAWLLQPTGGTDLAATALSILGVLAWLLQAAGWPGGTGLAAAAHRGFRPGCYSPQDSLGYWPGCYRPQVGLGVLA